MPTNDTFEMPAEMRAFIERGMQQARAALDTWLAAAQQAAGAAQNRAASTQTGIREMGELAVGYAERNLAAETGAGERCQGDRRSARRICEKPDADARRTSERAERARRQTGRKRVTR